MYIYIRAILEQFILFLYSYLNELVNSEKKTLKSALEDTASAYEMSAHLKSQWCL